MRIEDRFTVSLPVQDTWDVLRDVERIAPCMPGAQLQEVEDDSYRGIVKVKLGAISAQYKGVVRFTDVDQAAHRMVLQADGRETRGQGNASATITATLRDTGGGKTEVVIQTDLSITGRVAQFGRGVMDDVSSAMLKQFVNCLEADLVGPAPVAEADGGGDAPADTTTATAGPVAVPAPTSSATDADTAQANATMAPAATSATDVDAAHAAANDGAASTVADVPPVGPSAVPPEQPVRETNPGAGPRRVQSAEPEPVNLMAMAGPSITKRALPAAIAGLFVLHPLVRGRFKRVLLSLAGIGLVVASVTAGRQS